eukprot:1638649-Pyramimonas_sp.AAC.1
MSNTDDRSLATRLGIQVAQQAQRGILKSARGLIEAFWIVSSGWNCGSQNGVRGGGLRMSGHLPGRRCCFPFAEPQMTHR